MKLVLQVLLFDDQDEMVASKQIIIRGEVSQLMIINYGPVANDLVYNALKVKRMPSM